MSSLSQTDHPTCLVTPRELALIKRKVDCTCEELGVFPEDENARRSIGRALMAAAARGDLDLDAVSASTATETLSFEGEDLVVAVTSPRH